MTKHTHNWRFTSWSGDGNRPSPLKVTIQCGVGMPDGPHKVKWRNGCGERHEVTITAEAAYKLRGSRLP